MYLPRYGFGRETRPGTPVATFVPYTRNPHTYTMKRARACAYNPIRRNLPLPWRDLVEVSMSIDAPRTRFGTVEFFFPFFFFYNSSSCAMSIIRKRSKFRSQFRNEITIMLKYINRSCSRKQFAPSIRSLITRMTSKFRRGSRRVGKIDRSRRRVWTLR